MEVQKRPVGVQLIVAEFSWTYRRLISILVTYITFSPLQFVPDQDRPLNIPNLPGITLFRSYRYIAIPDITALLPEELPIVIFCCRDAMRATQFRDLIFSRDETMEYMLIWVPSKVALTEICSPSLILPESSSEKLTNFAAKRPRSNVNISTPSI